MEAYFRDFKADGVEQPHKLFTGSWRLPTAAQYLGLSPESLDGSENSYVLVKLLRNKATKSVTGNIRLGMVLNKTSKLKSNNFWPQEFFIENFVTKFDIFHEKKYKDLQYLFIQTWDT